MDGTMPSVKVLIGRPRLSSADATTAIPSGREHRRDASQADPPRSLLARVLRPPCPTAGREDDQVRPARRCASWPQPGAGVAEDPRRPLSRSLARIRLFPDRSCRGGTVLIDDGRGVARESAVRSLGSGGRADPTGPTAT